MTFGRPRPSPADVRPHDTKKATVASVVLSSTFTIPVSVMTDFQCFSSSYMPLILESQEHSIVQEKIARAQNEVISDSIFVSVIVQLLSCIHARVCPALPRTVATDRTRESTGLRATPQGGGRGDTNFTNVTVISRALLSCMASSGEGLSECGPGMSRNSRPTT